jgi:hypothetical protein
LYQCLLPFGNFNVLGPEILLAGNEMKANAMLKIEKS